MANEDDQPNDEEVVDSTDEVENESSDESSVEDTISDDTGEETDDEAEDSDSTDEPEQFERRYTQFKADDIPGYVKQLEDAYAKSTTEGQRLYDQVQDLREEVINITANQSSSEDQEGTNTNQSVAERLVVSEYRKKSRQAYNDFVEAHPELKEDTVLAQRLHKKVGIAARVAMEEDGEMLDMDEALRIGWASLGYDNDSGQDTSNVQAIKEQTAVSKTTNRKKKAKKEEFSPEQLAVAKRMYPNKSVTELSELLAKHKAS